MAERKGTYTGAMKEAAEEQGWMLREHSRPVTCRRWAVGALLHLLMCATPGRSIGQCAYCVVRTFWAGVGTIMRSDATATGLAGRLSCGGNKMGGKQQRESERSA